ncbi:alpha/beta fold hydrolase [Aquiflexum sp.]|uniref:alpha/beta fold hydrolase n=1 Tax=Aquiflexum sp. TaxID=1872584 RepID=UPI003593F938
MEKQHNQTTRIKYSVHGSELSVIAKGKPTDPVVLFLHGIPANAELWRQTMETVSKAGYYCMAPDLPGYGLSRIRSKKFYSLKGTAELFIKWLHQEGFQDVWLVGHDIGGGIAQLMAVNQPYIFSKITLSNCITDDSWPVKSVQDMIKAAKLGLFFLACSFWKVQS